LKRSVGHPIAAEQLLAARFDSNFDVRKSFNRLVFQSIPMHVIPTAGCSDSWRGQLKIVTRGFEEEGKAVTI
jgi:hypothetical protein